MIELLAAIVVVGWLFIVGGLVWFGCVNWREWFGAADRYVAIASWLIAALIFIAPIAYLTTDHSHDKPCARYETGYSTVSTGKTTITAPYRYCAQYGEWIDPQGNPTSAPR
jgi:hypothetical protein